MRTIDVGIGHDHDLVIACRLQIELLADSRTDCGDHGADFFVGENPVDARALHVEDLPLEREDGLERSVSALLGATAGRVALDEVELAKRRI